MKQLFNLKHAMMVLTAAIVFFACTSGKKIPAQNLATDPDYPITETYWKLTELMGQPVTTTADMKKEMHLILKTEGARVQGNGGCNGFMGSYTLLEGNRLSFSQMAGTKMACSNMELENQFMEILSRVDNYAIKGKVLSLNKARMSPLARFEAVLMK
jgi:heat shock protein HslJ